jgi:hypothetical protein
LLVAPASPIVCNAYYSKCTSCGSANAGCSVNADCCNGYTCDTSAHKCKLGTSTCTGAGQDCSNSATAACCQGLYCDSPGAGADAGGGARSCTAAPSCKRIGDTCAAYTDCCESASMDCLADKCCILGSFQNTSQIKCYATSDCCTGTCNTTTGQCQ